MRLGKNQLHLLEAVAAGKACTHHAGQGRMHVHTGALDGVHESVLDRLFDHDMITLGEQLISGHKLVLTDKGRAELERRNLI